MSWILLRGLTREARHWGAFTARFAECMGEETITLDLPGNGEFIALDSPLAVSGMVEFARHQLRARGMAKPCKLLAMSLGGMVATDWAQRFPHEVSQLVLINTSMRPHGGLLQRLRPSNWPTLAMLAARWHDPDYAERVIHQLTCNRRDTQAADISDWLNIRKNAPVSEANAQRQLWAAARFACAAQPPACPTLLLSSAADHLVNPQCSLRLANAWQVEHRQHPWAGHDLPHDDPAWVCSMVAGG